MKTKHKPRRTRNALVGKWLLLIIPAIAMAIFIGRQFEQGRGGNGSERHSALPFFESAEAAQPYPETLSPSRFGKGHTARAYQAAKDIPGVLAQQPCYCFCTSEGHKSLLDCFTSNHAAGCTICQQEALFAERLNREGKTAAEIRQAIARGEWRQQPLE